MNVYVTQIKAVSPKTGDIKMYAGPNVPGISFADAQDYCDNNGLGYCKVFGQLIAEVPCDPGTNKPDWENMVDYETKNLN